MRWLRRMWNTLRPQRMRRDIDRELAFHLAERADDLRASGMDARTAQARARAQLGGVALQTERTRDVDVSRVLDATLRHLRHACRSLARTPGVTLTVVLTLALGLGASSTIFSALNAVLLRPLPFPDADRLMQVTQTQARTAETNIAPARLDDWNRLNTTFEAITGYFTEDASETSGDMPERIRRAFVAPNFVEVWGVRPSIGRSFVASEHRAGGPPAVLVSDRYWRRRFGASRDLSSAAIHIGSRAIPIIGVMPDSFLFPDRRVDLWFPVAISAQLQRVRQATWYRGVGRLKPGVTVDQARADLAAVQARLGDQYPDTDRTIGVSITPLETVTIGDVGGSLWLLFGAVSVLLLITCTNIAAVLLARAAHRRQEIAVRLSLGATGRSIGALVLAETALLALAGGALGLLAATAAAAALRSLTVAIPRLDEVTVDTRVLLYTFASALVVTALCGLLPAVRAVREGRLGARSGDRRREVSSQHRAQWLLVAVQVTLSVTLLSGAGLLVRSLHELWRIDPGFDPQRVLTFRVSGDWAETAQYDRLTQRIDRMLAGARALPGVESAATAVFAPGVPTEYESTFTLVEARGEGEDRLVAESRAVSPDYFATLRIPLADGALCRTETASGDRQVLVNRSFVRRYLADRPSPIGLHLSTDRNAPSRIVGVVGDARERGIDRDAGPIVYGCRSAPNPTPLVLVRTTGDPTALAGAIRTMVKGLEPLRAVYEIETLEARIGEAYTRNRLRAGLLSIFALTALVLACVGLYGTLSYVVNLRRREIGLRLALGAMRGDIVRRFLWQGLRVTAAACLVGLALARGIVGTMSTMLVGVSPTDPLTLGAVAGLVLIVAGVAALVPAARAALVEPMRVLREE